MSQATRSSLTNRKTDVNDSRSEALRGAAREPMCYRAQRFMNRLAGKVAIVTGAASGFGAEIASRFAEEGARLVLADLDPVAGERTARQVGGDFLAADVSSSADSGRMIATAVERFGRLDVLVNNAGRPQVPASIAQTDEQEFDRL